MIKLAYIKKLPNGKYRVYSEKGKNMGTYDSEKAAKKRLREIEFFKHRGNFIADLSKLADYLDQARLKKEADTVDQLTKYVVAMDPEEYERYYGKSKYEGSGKELDVSKPEDYKKYYGKEMLPVAKDILPKKPEPEENDADWQIELVTLIDSMRDTEYGRDATLNVSKALSGSDYVVAILRFKNDIRRDVFLEREMPKLKAFRRLNPNSYVAYYGGDQTPIGYVAVKPGRYDHEAYIVVSSYIAQNEPKVRQILSNLSE